MRSCRLLQLGAVVLAACVVIGTAQPPTPAQQQAVADLRQSYERDLKEDGALAKAWCSAPDFKAKSSCATNGVVKQDEARATVKKQCPLCGTLYTPLADVFALPQTISGVDRYNQFHTAAVSLACSGRSVVRAVFKPLYTTSVSGTSWRNCTDSRLVQIDEGADNNASPVVRCELALPAGPGSEAERALKAKEARCYVCDLCSKGGGCPSNQGTWYSDSYTTTLQGCAFGDRYQVHRVGINMNPGAKVLLAKFEVCNAPPCFDRAYEEAKARSAKKCVNGVCPA